MRVLLLLLLRAEIAVSPNNNVVNIYEKKAKEWVKIHELREHSGRITGTSSTRAQRGFREPGARGGVFLAHRRTLLLRGP